MFDKILRARALVLVILATGSLPAPIQAAAAQSGPPATASFDHFITRRGARLYDGDKEFRFLGANMPGLVVPYDFTMDLSERMSLPTPWEQEDAFKTLAQMNFKVVRTWNLPIRGPKEIAKPWHYVLGPGQFSEEAFKAVDHLFALANQYRVRVIFDLTAGSGDYLGGAATYAAHRGKSKAEFYTDQQVREDFKATLRFVLNRINSVTGVRYGDDKAVLAWQYGNEMNDATDAWLAEMGAYMKSLAPHHLVSETRHRPGVPMFVNQDVDLVTRHLYANYPGVEAGWPASLKKDLGTLNEERPLYIGEFGPYIDGKMFTPDNVVGKVRELVDYVQSEPRIAGAMIWSMYFHREAGGFYWHQIFTYPAVWSYHWPGFPSASAQREQELMRLLREAAFRIDGKSVPPVPRPDSPVLLPIGDVPQISWRGSTGADNYDVERAAAAAGPWTAIANGISDADSAYRPLFSDTTAKAGQTWFYRVSARNASGVSAPSNVVGPVRVGRVCLADELQDFSRTQSHSPKLVLNNAYNGLYAEYLFRAKGDVNDWVSYAVPASMEQVKVSAFFPGGGTIPHLVLESSADGVSFAPMQTERVERALRPPPGGPGEGQRRTMVDYECRPPAGQRFLKILWQGPGELDRVEICHHGQP